MKLSKILVLISGIAMLGSTLANAAYKSFGDFSYGTRDVRIERAYEVPDFSSRAFKVVHTCATEGYQCASGTSCELVMSRSGRSKYGVQLQLNGNTNLHYYSCNGSTSLPKCSIGTPVKTASGYKCLYIQ